MVTRELLDAIIAAPDDDATRRVYGDALLDDGDPLGELIHLQLDLAGHELAYDDRMARRERERELLAEHVERWAAPIIALVPTPKRWGPVVPSPRFRRGLVDEVSIDAGTFVECAEQLFEMAPLLRGVSLEGIYDEDAADFVFRKYRAAMGSPWMERLHGLRCQVGSYRVEGYESRHVDLAMAAEAMPILIDAVSRMPNLRALAMFDPEDRLQQLIDTGLFARLDRFDFGNFSVDNVIVALDAFAPGRLVNVSLPWFDKAELVTLLAHPHLQAVEELSVKRPLLDNELEPLFESLRALPKLRRLELADMRGEPVPLPDLEELALPRWSTTSVFGWS